VGVVVELRKLANDAKVGGQSGERERRATAVGSSRRQAPAAAQWVLHDKSLAAGAWRVVIVSGLGRGGATGLPLVLVFVFAFVCVAFVSVTSAARCA
jgi:hypothetical protein